MEKIRTRKSGQEAWVQVIRVVLGNNDNEGFGET